MSKNHPLGFSLLEVVVALAIFNLGLLFIDWHITRLYLKLGQQETAIQSLLKQDRELLLVRLADRRMGK